jgi:hypothetical protein
MDRIPKIMVTIPKVLVFFERVELFIVVIVCPFE